MDPILEEELLRNVEMASARGHVQRAKAAARNRGPPGGGDSGLANHLLVKWTYGTKSAELVKTEAALAYKAGARGGYLKQLSEIGSKQGGNVARDLMELVREILGVAIVPILVVLVPLFVSKGEGGLPQPELCPVGFICPHIWLWFMYTHHRPEFLLRFCGANTLTKATARISKFWSSVHPADPRRSNLFNQANFATRCLPIGLHGDGVPCTKRNSLDVLTFFGILGMGSTVDLVFYIWSFFYTCKVDAATLLDFPAFLGGLTEDTSYRVIIWSLLALESGIHPTHDYRGELLTEEPFLSLAGTAIAGGFFAILWQFRCDADYTYKNANLPGYWASNYPCHTCGCDKVVPRTPNHFLYFGADASWPDSIYLTMAAFYVRCALAGKAVHPLLTERANGGGGYHVFLFCRDTLHVLDLGTSQYLAGTVFWLLSFADYIYDNDPVRAMHQVMADVAELYRTEKTPTTFSNLDLQMFCDADRPQHGTPCLKGKGAETRHLIPLLAIVWAKYSRGTAYDNHVTACLNAMTAIYSILGVRDPETSAPPLFLDAAACDELRGVVDEFLTHYSYLESVAVRNDPPLGIWHMVSKHHSVWHVAFEAQFQHPSSGRTYINESYMGHIKEVGMANRFAIAASRRSLTICERVALGRSLELLITAKRL